MQLSRSSQVVNRVTRNLNVQDHSINKCTTVGERLYLLRQLRTVIHGFPHFCGSESYMHWINSLDNRYRYYKSLDTFESIV